MSQFDNNHNRSDQSQRTRDNTVYYPCTNFQLNSRALRDIFGKEMKTMQELSFGMKQTILNYGDARYRSQQSQKYNRKQHRIWRKSISKYGLTNNQSSTLQITIIQFKFVATLLHILDLKTDHENQT